MTGRRFITGLCAVYFVIQTQIGELIVGSYLRLINDCELVSYNQRSKEAGRQMEIDVLGVESTSGKQTVYACEVITHLDGTLYSGSPDTDEWVEYGNEGYQYTLERIWDKFHEDYDLLTEVFDDADEYALQFWSPYVPRGYRPTVWMNYNVGSKPNRASASTSSSTENTRVE